MKAETVTETSRSPSKRAIAAPTVQWNRDGAAKGAFTLTELLVVIGILVLLAAVLMPALALSRSDSFAARCMSNHRQIAAAWQMYASVNGDRFPPNANSAAGPSVVPNWCEGWLSFEVNTTDNTNWHQLVDIRSPFGSSASLGPYLGMSPRPYKCPEDVMLCGEGAKLYPRVRSIAMNGFVEGGAYGMNQNSNWYPQWRAYSKVSDLGHPSPANLILTMDIHPSAINFAWFIADVENISSDWEVFPASYHNRGAGMSFADGHSEVHQWQSQIAPQIPEYGVPQPITNASAKADVFWLTNHLSDTITGG